MISSIFSVVRSLFTEEASELLLCSGINQVRIQPDSLSLWRKAQGRVLNDNHNKVSTLNPEGWPVFKNLNSLRNSQCLKG